MADSALDTAPAAPEMNTSAELPPASAVDEGALLSSLRQQLESIRQNAQAAFDRVSEDLQRLQRPPAEPACRSEGVTQNVADTLACLARRQDSFETLLRESLRALPLPSSGPLPEIASGSQSPEWAVQWQATFNEQVSRWERRLESLVEEVKTRIPEPSAAPDIVAEAEPLDLRPSEPVAPANSQSETWLRVLLGNDLFNNTELKRSVDWIEQQALSDNSDALLLLGQLLVFRFSSADRKPTLLKEVGEAFYRCFPKIRDERDHFEESLAAWLTKQCDAVGLPNSIELVHFGERFDASKHAPIERGGVEIARVLGWVVLRDGGRVFSKAAVQTR